MREEGREGEGEGGREGERMSEKGREGGRERGRERESLRSPPLTILYALVRAGVVWKRQVCYGRVCMTAPRVWRWGVKEVEQRKRETQKL